MRLRGLQTFTQTVGLQAECGVLESRLQVYGELLGCCKASQASRSSLGGAVCVRASPFSLSRALALPRSSVKRFSASPVAPRP